MVKYGFLLLIILLRWNCLSKVKACLLKTYSMSVTFNFKNRRCIYYAKFQELDFLRTFLNMKLNRCRFTLITTSNAKVFTKENRSHRAIEAFLDSGNVLQAESNEWNKMENILTAS